jgi:hypothetical protein
LGRREDLHRKKAALLVAIIGSLLAVGLLAHNVSAATAGAISNVDTRTASGGGGISTNVYSIGSTVYIYWANIIPSDGTVDLAVYGPDGSLVAQWFNLAPEASGTEAVSFSVTQTGYYDIKFNGERDSVSLSVASVSLLVTPESSWGTVMAVIACAGAFGIFKIRKNRQK